MECLPGVQERAITLAEVLEQQNMSPCKLYSHGESSLVMDWLFEFASLPTTVSLTITASDRVSVLVSNKDDIIIRRQWLIPTVLFFLNRWSDEPCIDEPSI